MDITLVLTLDEVNNVLAMLDDHPHKYVAGIIGKINNQAAPQVQAENEKRAKEGK